MLMQVETLGKLSSLAPGSQVSYSGGLFGEGLVSHLMPRYGELARRGNIWSISTPAAGITIAAANVSPLAAGTGQPIIGVWNPKGSDLLIILLRTWFMTRSGTPGGPLVWNTIQGPTLTTPTFTQPINNRTFLAGGSGKYIVNNALTGGQVATLFRPAVAFSAVAAAAFQGKVDDDLAGAICLWPDSFIGLAATAAGTIHVVDGYIEVAEISLGLTGG
jgi:hypothetical protein